MYAFTSRLVLFCSALTLLVFATPAAAQEEIVLELQQQLVRERRLADGRQRELIVSYAAERRDLQRQIADARRRGGAAAQRVASLTSRLNDAMARERELLSSILERDPASRLLVTDLAAALRQLSTGASPAVRAAIARFAAGDRLGAWPGISALAQTGSARDARVAAMLRGIMFSHSDAGVTADDVVVRWRSAVAADRNNSLAWVGLAAAQQMAGHPEGALEALAGAKDAAETPQERYAISQQRTAVGRTLMRPGTMVDLLTEQLADARALSGTIAPTERLWMEQQIMTELAESLRNGGRNADAVATYRDALGVLGELKALNPQTGYVADAIAGVLLRKGQTETQLNRIDEAFASFEEAAATLGERIESQPGGSAGARALLVDAHIGMCNLRLSQRAVADAVPICDGALRLYRDIPESPFRDFNIARDTVFVGILMYGVGEVQRAADRFREAVEIWHGLAERDRSPSILFGYADALHRLAVTDPETCWRRVSAAWDALQAATTPTPEQLAASTMARQLAEAGTGCPEERLDSPAEPEQQTD